MINWDEIQNVLLDMDGTLLDLNFDNHFWREHLPSRYAQKHDVTLTEAKTTLYARFQEVEGTIQWYCLDYWSEELEMDIPILKEEVAHLIATHPYVIDFLRAMRRNGKHTALVTNAHNDSLSLKMKHTSIGEYLDAVISSHDIGIAKEAPEFWQKLQKKLPFQPTSSLLIDDNLSVLRSAKAFGISHLLAVKHPDSKMPANDGAEFESIKSFLDIMPYDEKEKTTAPSA